MPLKLSANNVFLIDAIGALLSTLMLGVVLVHFESYIGMPESALCPLAFVAALFTIYSGICHFIVNSKWKPCLRIIAMANALYCFASIIVVTYHYEQLTTLGMIYFLGEFAVISIIVTAEYKLIKRAKYQN